MISRASLYGPRTSIVDGQGTFTYNDLLEASSKIAAALLSGRDDLREERVAFLVTPGFSWVATQWGIWQAGGVAVPLPLSATLPELEYVVADTGATALVFDTGAPSFLEPLAADRGLRAFQYGQLCSTRKLRCRKSTQSRRAMILYTSGTTSRPKGVVTTHFNIAAQIKSLVEAWEWSPNDRILLCLPLHHVHGIINVVGCALWSGATCEMLPRFHAATVWDRIAGGGLTLFMGVPTVYSKLIAAWEGASPERRAQLSEACSKLAPDGVWLGSFAREHARTMEANQRPYTAGALRNDRDWYGAVESAARLTRARKRRNTAARRRGSTGGGRRQPGCPGNPGRHRGAGSRCVRRILGQARLYPRCFPRFGWFITGDTAVVENGVYRILGRTNIDILKTGGHKISALEIEEVLRRHPAIAECSILGIADEEWGERVAAAVVLQ